MALYAIFAIKNRVLTILIAYSQPLIKGVQSYWRKNQGLDY